MIPKHVFDPRLRNDARQVDHWSLGHVDIVAVNNDCRRSCKCLQNVIFNVVNQSIIKMAVLYIKISKVGYYDVRQVYRFIFDQLVLIKMWLNNATNELRYSVYQSFWIHPDNHLNHALSYLVSVYLKRLFHFRKCISLHTEMALAQEAQYAQGDEDCIDPRGKLLCLWHIENNYAAHAWHHSIHNWLLGRSSCSSPSVWPVKIAKCL